MLRKIVALLALCGMVAVAAGCNTVAGAGADMKAAGAGIEKAAEKNEALLMPIARVRPRIIRDRLAHCS